MSEDLALRQAIAEELLGCALENGEYAPCPGQDLHSNRGGRRDFRVVLTQAPTGFCFHDSCADNVESFNRELRQRIGKAEAEGRLGKGETFGKVSRRPVAKPRPKRPPFDLEALKRFAAKCPVEITQEWLLERSPLDFPGRTGEQGLETAEAMLSALYAREEKVLVFTTPFSQGDFLFSPGKGSFRLAEKPGVNAVPSPLPSGGQEGVWFLVQPVEGQWRPNRNNKEKDGTPKLGRRHGDCVTAWRFLVLESDHAPEELWLKALVQLPFPIAAIYTSGGRSVHALVKVDCKTKSAFDQLRDYLVQVLAPVGGDSAAMTAVRLSRLPGLYRHGSKDKDGKLQPYPEPRLQKLLWLNPAAKAEAILTTTKH
ncbi:hypothetical protein N9A86_02695 [Akkermansiaceae bacterium]|nr:hypothetical protein [Akkermansiaceae bacterium]MDB4544613.1 hypothetical protein [Akkermansiaceae bacterium]